jgi:hypothetical protein
MLKKSLIFGSAALFLAALITLTGCPTSVDDGSSGTVYAHRIYGTAVSPYVAQEAINRAVAAGEPIVLEDGLTLAAGHLNFKNAQVRIEGRVSATGALVISVVDASVTWADNAFLTLGTATSAYIHRIGQDTSKVTAGTPVEFAESLETIMPTATAAGVRRFKLGPKQNFDYSTNPDGINARISAVSLGTLYVLDELVIDTGATNPSATPALAITALGTVDVTGTPPAGVIPGTTGVLPLGTCSTLTTSKGGVVVTVPATATSIPNIKVDEGKDFIITQATAGTLTIPGKLTGEGTLEVLGAVTELTIAGGDGSIRFSGAAVPTAINAGNTGTITFEKDLTSLANPSTIAGDAVFNGALTTTKALALNGNVTLASGKAVTLGSGEALTLGAGKTVSVRFTPRNGDPVVAPVLSAGSGNVVLTPGGASTLTAPADPTQTSDAAIAAAKRLTLAGGALTVTDGVLRVAPDASLAVDTVALTTGTTVTTIGYLGLEDGGSLVLTGTTVGTVVIGDTTISGASTLKASGGIITLGNNKISGSAPGAVLAAASGTPVFTLASAKLLTLDQADLNLASNGNVVITDTARVILTEQAKITLNNGEGGVPTTRRKIGANGLLSGGFVGLTSPTATTTQQVWSVAHESADAADVSITADGANVTLAKSGTTFNN